MRVFVSVFLWFVLFGVLSAVCKNAIDNRYPSKSEISKMEIKELLDKYLTWTSFDPSKKSFIADEENPYHKPLLEKGKLVAEYVSKNKEQYTLNGKLNLHLVWILGEIADPSSFDILLTNYLASPDYRLAISLAACTTKDNIEKVVSSLDDKSLFEFMKVILSEEEFNQINSKNKTEIIEFWQKNYDSIQKKVIARTIPMPMG